VIYYIYTKKGVNTVIKTEELCEYLNIHKNTAYNWRKSGMPFYGKTETNFRYDLNEVKEWLKNNS